MIFIFPLASIFYQFLWIYPLLFFWLQKGGLLIPAKMLFAAVLLSLTLFFLQSLCQSIREILNESTSLVNEILKSKVLVSRRLWRDECYCFDANNFHFKSFLLILFIGFRLPGKITLDWAMELNHSCLAMPERDWCKHFQLEFLQGSVTISCLQPFMKANHRERCRRGGGNLFYFIILLHFSALFTMQNLLTNLLEGPE